jgi:hemerythrin-like domain-containing protein
MQESVMTDLAGRKGLPEGLRILVEQYPRNIWTSHSNFDELTRFWLERHVMFRDVLQKLRVETQTYLDKSVEPQVFMQRSARMTSFFLEQLHGHHHIEDTHYFPKLAAVEPRLESGFTLLDADHHALNAHLQALADVTNVVLRLLQAGKGNKAHDAAGKLERQLHGFERFLNRHLLDEEDLVIPTILHHAPDL